MRIHLPRTNCRTRNFFLICALSLLTPIGTSTARADVFVYFRNPRLNQIKPAEVNEALEKYTVTSLTPGIYDKANLLVRDRDNDTDFPDSWSQYPALSLRLDSGIKLALFYIYEDPRNEQWEIISDAIKSKTKHVVISLERCPKIQAALQNIRTKKLNLTDPNIWHCPLIHGQRIDRISTPPQLEIFQKIDTLIL